MCSRRSYGSAGWGSPTGISGRRRARSTVRSGSVLWQRVFARFFVWVWISVIVLPVTGYVIVWGQWGGLGSMPLHAHLMQGLGWVMIAFFLYLWFVPYRRFKAALAAGDPPSAAAALDRIRLIVKTNLAIGLINAAIGASGRYWTL